MSDLQTYLNKHPVTSLVPWEGMPTAKITHRMKVSASEVTVEPELRDRVTVNISDSPVTMSVERKNFAGGLLCEVLLAGPV